MNLGKGRNEQDFNLNERDSVHVDRERRNQKLYEIEQAEESVLDRLIVEVEQEQQAFQPENGSDAPSVSFDERMLQFLTQNRNGCSAVGHQIAIEQMESVFDRLIAEVEQKQQAFQKETETETETETGTEKSQPEMSLSRAYCILAKRKSRLIAEVEQKQQAFQKETETETETETGTEKSQPEMSLSGAYCVRAEERCLFPTNVTPSHSKGASIIAPNALPVTRLRVSVHVDQQRRDQVIGRDKRDQVTWRDKPDSKLSGPNLGKERDERASDLTRRLKRGISKTEIIDEVIPEVDFHSAFLHKISIQQVESDSPSASFDERITEIQQQTHQECSRDSDSDPAVPPHRTHCDLIVPPHLRSRVGIVNPTHTEASRAIHMQTMATHIAVQSHKPKHAHNLKIKRLWLI